MLINYHQLAPVNAPWLFQHFGPRELPDLQKGDDPQLWSSFNVSQIDASVRHSGTALWIPFLKWLATEHILRKNYQLPSKFASLLQCMTSVAGGSQWGESLGHDFRVKSIYFIETARFDTTTRKYLSSWGPRHSAYDMIESELRMSDKDLENLHSRHIISRVPGLSVGVADYVLSDDVNLCTCQVPRSSRVVEGRKRLMMLWHIDICNRLVNRAQFNCLFVERTANGYLANLKTGRRERSQHVFENEVPLKAKTAIINVQYPHRKDCSEISEFA